MQLVGYCISSSSSRLLPQSCATACEAVDQHLSPQMCLQTAVLAAHCPPAAGCRWLHPYWDLRLLPQQQLLHPFLPAVTPAAAPAAATVLLQLSVGRTGRRHDSCRCVRSSLSLIQQNDDIIVHPTPCIARMAHSRLLAADCSKQELTAPQVNTFSARVAHISALNNSRDLARIIC